MCITKETKWHPWGCCHDNSFASGAVSLKTEIPSFCVKQEPASAAYLMIKIKTIWELCLFQAGTLNGYKWRYLVFGQRETGAERVVMATILGCHVVPFVMHICGAKFKEHCLSISRDIFHSVFQHLLHVVANFMTSSLI